MRKLLLPALAVLVVVMCGCTYSFMMEETTQADTEYIDITVAESTSISENETVTEYSEESSYSEEHSSEEASDTLPLQTQEPTSSEFTTEEMTAETEQNSEADTTVSFTEVDLSIDMPDKNGTMKTDSSADNKFIRIVNSDRKIDEKYLVAVFSVPESGQNYVFEFYSEESRTADNIRRVYLIDEKGKITSVAAAKASEKENISSVENWFCLNVLIKEIIFPAIAEEVE